jgi:hypothetical protein
MTYLSGKPIGPLAGQSMGPLSVHGAWSGYPDFSDIDDVNPAKLRMHLASFGVDPFASSNGSNNRSAGGKATTLTFGRRGCSALMNFFVKAAWSPVWGPSAAE